MREFNYSLILPFITFTTDSFIIIFPHYIWGVLIRWSLTPICCGDILVNGYGGILVNLYGVH